MRITKCAQLDESRIACSRKQNQIVDSKNSPKERNENEKETVSCSSNYGVTVTRTHAAAGGYLYDADHIIDIPTGKPVGFTPQIITKI